MNPPRQLLDKALDLAVAPGYSAAGYRLRGLSWEEAIAGDSLRGEIAVVTGASAGIGEAISMGLASAGARVQMLVRDRERGERARERIAARRAGHSSGELELELCDVAELAAVREFAARFSERELELRGVLNNAGVLPAERRRPTRATS